MGIKLTYGVFMIATKKYLPRAIAGVSLLIYLAFAFFLYRYNILPIKYRVLILTIFPIVLVLYGILAYKKKIKKPGNIVFLIILIIISLSELVFMSYANTSIKTINEISNKDTSLMTEMSYIVRADSPYKSLEDIKDKKLAVAETEDEETLKEVLAKYKDEYKTDLEESKYIDYLSLAKGLLRGKEDVILLNEGFRNIVEETEDTFNEETRVLGSSLVESKANEDQTDKEEVAEDGAFNVYISGIDTYGSLSNVSRSDVNLVISVNPVKGKVLITTIPRDSYVDIPGKGMDKLTHAGLFGVDSSIQTIENLLNINIDYYGKVNFTTLTELIDMLGGIDVDSPVAFTSLHGNYYFNKGINHLDGDKALAFARERYHLVEGDFDRGRNHTRIIAAIINKMLRPEMLLNFNNISQVALKSVNTDMPYEKMIELVNKQIDSGKKWEIQSQSLEGTGTMDLKSALMPEAKLYMMVVNEESLAKVEKKIEENNK